MVFYFLAIVVGILITLTPILNGRNVQKIGSLKTAFFHNTAAFTFGLLLMLIFNPTFSSVAYEGLPQIYFLGGFVGLLVLLSMNHYATRIKAFSIVILPFLGQMFMGFLIDYYVFNLLDVKRILGMFIVLIGIMIPNLKKPLPFKIRL